MTVRIASYNLWNGAASTYFRLIDFAKDQGFDVLCLQEVNGWQAKDFERLKDFADRADFNTYEFGNSNSEYKMATFSRLPVTFRDVHVEGFWHCAIETRVQAGDTEISIINLHLDPWKEDPRLREIERLLRLIDVSKPTIITGDINSISRQDNLAPEFLAELQKRKVAKYGASELDYRVTDFLTAAGFVDAAVQLGHVETTVPTPFSTEEEHEVPARIDCAYVSSSLVPQLRDFEVIKNSDTDKISDHYPIVLTLEIAGQPAPELHDSSEVSDDESPATAEPSVQTGDNEVEIKLH